jgi:arginyl-tRNA synthetase
MYAISSAKKTLRMLLAFYFEGEEMKIEKPPFSDKGDIAVPIFVLSKKLKKPPTVIAAELAGSLSLENTEFDRVVAEGGFLNFFLNPVTYTEAVMQGSERPDYGVPDNITPERIVLDYSSPNVAKEMHVGHLRSTVIGDALRRIYTFVGHTVIAQNHLGDWGTQFGMLIEHLIDTQLDPLALTHIGDLNALYQAAKQRDDAEPDFKERARKRVVLLQQGDALTLRIWQSLTQESMRHFNAVYHRLGVLLTDNDLKPESAYNAALQDTVAKLTALGLITEDAGALCIFLPGFEREGKPVPLILQKTDGGFLYATTDLAALYYRFNTLKADRLLYVVDVRQGDHFKMLFAAAQKAHWLPEGQATHVAFGTILGKDNKPFKTREGGTVRLSDLLDEAVKRADALIVAKNPDISEADRQKLAEQVGIGALKYADLHNDRRNDYVFDWDRLLSFDGNTAPYLQYAAVRLQSLLHKALVTPANGVPSSQAVTPAKAGVQSSEFNLVKKLSEFPEIIEKILQTQEPHLLTTYLFTLAQTFTTFYDAVPILKAPEVERLFRLRLCQFTLKVLTRGLGLLGIECPKKM